MLKTSYKNPNTETFQYEYAIYMLIADRFKSVTSRSAALDTLRLYYAELVRENENGHFSYEKQYKLEDEVERLLSRDLRGIPDMPHRTATVTVKTRADGTHWLIFRSGADAFAVRFERTKKTKRIVCAALPS